MTTVSSYEVGTLLIDMLDLKNFTMGVDETIDIPWSGVVRGVLDDAEADVLQRIKDGIDQAFFDSPYLIKQN